MKIVSLVQSVTAFETVRAFIDSTEDVPESVFSAVACIQDYLLNRPIKMQSSFLDCSRIYTV